MSALRADGLPEKAPLDFLYASEVNLLRAAADNHADLLDQYGPQLLNLLQQAAASGKTLYPLALPQAVVAGPWYVTDSGIWQAKQNFNASAAPAAGAYWQVVAKFAGQADSLPSAGISDATAAGRAMLTAASAAAQRALVNNPKIRENQYGTHPAFTATDGEGGFYQWLIQTVQAAAGAGVVAAPEAPTSVEVNDVSKEWVVKLTSTYPSYAQYGISGLPGTVGEVALGASNAYQVGDTVHIKVGSAVAKGNLSLRVVGSGNVPNGTPLVNPEAFTGAATTTPTQPTTTALTVGLAIAVASIMAGQPLRFTVTTGGGAGGYTYAVVATSTTTGTSINIGSAASGSWTPTRPDDYDITATVTDSAGVSKTSPVRALHVSGAPLANAGSDLVLTQPASSATLQGSGYEQAGTIVGYNWNQTSGPVNVTFSSKTVAQPTITGATAVGDYRFNLIVTDAAGNVSLADEVVITVQAAPSTGSGSTNNTPLAISSFSPASGAVGAVITLNGTNFSGANSVKLNGVSLNYTVVSATKITATVPAGGTTGYLSVGTSGGETATSATQFTVQQASTSLVSKPTWDQLHFNTENNQYASGPMFSALAEYREYTDAPSAVFRVRTNMRAVLSAQTVDEATISIYLDNVFLCSLLPDQDNVEQDFPVTFPPGSGQRALRVVNGAQSRQNDNPAVEISGTSLVSITWPAGTTHTPIPWVKAAQQVAAWTDSIWSAIGSSVPGQFSAPVLLRTWHPESDQTMLDSYGSKRVTVAFADSNIAAQIARLHKVFDGAARQWLKLALTGFNDLAAGIAPSVIRDRLVAICEAVHAAFPNAKILLHTLMITPGESAQIKQLRAFIKAIAAARPGFVQLFDTQYLAPATMLADGVHFNDTAQYLMAKGEEYTGIYDVDAGSPTPPAGYTGAVAPYMLEDEDANTNYQAYEGDWTRINVNSVRPGTGQAAVLGQPGSCMYVQQGHVGKVRLRGWARGFRLFAVTTTSPNGDQGIISVTINGVEFLVDQRFANPQNDGRSWPFFESVRSEWKYYDITIKLGSETGAYPTGVYPIHNGMELLDGTGVYLTT